MILNSSTINDNESRKDSSKLRIKLEKAEQSRVAGEKTFSLDESRKRLEIIYAGECVVN